MQKIRLWIVGIVLGIAGVQAQAATAWSTQDYDLYPGDFNGDGLTDLLYISKDGRHANGIVLSDGTGLNVTLQSWGNAYLGIPWSDGTYNILVADFDGDGKADILLQPKAPGDAYLLLTEDGGVGAITQTIPNTAAGIVWSADQHVIVAGDFNGDGKADLFFQATDPKGLSAVIDADANGTFTAAQPTQSWTDGYLGLNWASTEARVYAADFNGDHYADLLIQAQPVQGTGENAGQPAKYPPNMNGAVLGRADPKPFVLEGIQAWSRNGFAADWSPLTEQVVTGDFNGDGRADVILQGLTSSNPSYFLAGNAPGAIFVNASTLSSTSTPSADSARLLAGQYVSGKGAELYLQAATRDDSNGLGSVTGNSLSVTAAELPGAAVPESSATTVQSAAAASPSGGTQAALLAVTSAGRTAGQFSISPTGAATYNIPIWTPPGARDIEPHLALHYTSGGPDGPMGPGWALSGQSMISRCAKTWASSGGAPAGVTLTTSDDICLDGNRLRLVTGSPMTAGATYQTELADFSNVKAYSAQGNGPQYFIVQGKDGRYYEYGNSTDSRVYSSGQTTPYVWALNKVRDRDGNYLTVTYAAGTALTVSKINYTATPGTSNSAPYEADFNYVARTGGTTITKYVANGTVSQGNQLDNITVLASGTIVRKYQLTYQASATTSRPLITSVQECGGSAGTDCLRPTSVTYQAGGAGWVTSPASTGLTGQYGFIPIDVNADGIPDAVYGKQSGSNTHWYAKIATLTGYGAEIDTGIVTSSSQRIISNTYSGTGQTQLLAQQSGTWYLYTYNGSGFTAVSTGVAFNGEVLAADYDGDGLPDLVSVVGLSILVRRNTSVSGGAVTFASAATTVWTTTDQTLSVGNGTAFNTADFNGDGKADLVAMTTFNTGFSTIVYWNVVYSNGFGAAATFTKFAGSGHSYPNVGDWNGDGCSDIISTYSIKVSNCANGFTSISTGIPVTDTANPVDWDGDGQTDIIYADSGNWYVKRSTGAGIGSAVSLGIAAPLTQSFFLMDRNADGLLDFGYIDAGSSFAVKYYPHAYANTPPDLGSAISDGFNISFNPYYVPITQSNYTKNSDGVFLDIDFQGAMYVVGQFVASDGLGGTYTNDFQYYGAHLNLQGRGFEGFASARMHDSRNNTYHYTSYSRSFPTIGAITQQYTTDGSTNLTQTTNHYTYVTLAGTNCSLRCFVYPDTSTTYNYEVTGSKKGQSISNQVTNYTYDAYGTLTNTQVTVTDTDATSPASPFNGQQWTTTIANSITNDPTNWCLGRPSRTTTTKTAPGYSTTRTVDHAIDYVKCRANSETVEPTIATLKVVTSFTFDACGNTYTAAVVGVDPSGTNLPQRVTTTDYGVRCQFPEKVYNALNQLTQTTYNYNLGVPASTTDPNNLTVSWQYDNFGRKKQETRPDGTYTQWAYSDCLTNCWGPTDLRFLSQEQLYTGSGTLIRRVYKYYDGLDRLRYLEGDRVLGVWNNERTNYDQLGRKAQAYLPYSSGNSGNGYHVYTYDIGNRPTQDALYDSNGVLYRTIGLGYSGQTASVTDPNGNTITKVTDVDGNIRQVTDPNTNGTVAGTTYYMFDGFKNLRRIQDATGAVSTFTYNVRGFKTGSVDADTGTWSFTPDSLNELWSQQDAKTQVTSFGYDLLGRMTSRTEIESATATQWVFGTSSALHNIGHVVQVTKPDGYAENYLYDAVARPQTVTYTVDGTNYAFDYGYNAYGTVDTLTYPTSTAGVRFALKSVYDSYGYLNQVKDNSAGTVFWSLSGANDASLPTSEVLGNGVTVATTYTPWTNEMVTRQEGTGGVANSLQDLAYQWDLTGNLHQRQDLKQLLTEVFAYDSMNRLKTSTLNSINNLAVAYDAAGNITNKSDVSASNYVYGDTAHKHAVTTAGAWSMSYDPNGNMATRAGGAITWYSYNLPNTISYSGNSAQFFYNANHQRWKQVANYGGTLETTRYVGGLLEVMTRGSVTEYRHQIPAGSNAAVYTRRTDGTTSTYYATSDHLGSADLVLSSTATVMAKESFTPFGARRGSNWQGVPTAGDYTAFSNTTRRGFTGHEMLDSVSLVHMNGRVYDPYLGRFLSADTVIQSLGASQSINPFAYAWNNPLRYVDPSGHDLFGAILGIFAAIIAIVFMQPELLVIGSGATMSVTTALVAGFAGGFVGALVSTGSLSAALTAGLLGALTGAAFAEVGSLGQTFQWTPATKVLAHAAVGCGSGMLSGGNCGRGAAAAALSETAVQAKFIKPAAIGTWGSIKGIAEAGLVGGAAARISGGSFDDGFTTAAAGYLFNSAAHSRPHKYEVDLIAEDGNPGHVFLGFMVDGEPVAAMGEYANDGIGKFLDAIFAGDSPSGQIKFTDIDLYKMALAGNKSFATMSFQVSEQAFYRAESYMIHFPEHSNYQVGYADCVHAAFGALHYAGIGGNTVYAMPFAAPSTIYRAINSLNASSGH